MTMASMHIFPWLTAISAAVAAGLWVYSSRVSEPAPPETAGVGALSGGYLISRLANGKRIDLHSTLELQSRWSGRAACAAAVSAVFSILSIYNP